VNNQENSPAEQEERSIREKTAGQQKISGRTKPPGGRKEEGRRDKPFWHSISQFAIKEVSVCAAGSGRGEPEVQSGLLLRQSLGEMNGEPQEILGRNVIKLE